MKHPAEIQLALFAGSDLGRWERWRVRRHVGRCAGCAEEVQALRAVGDDLREAAGEMPAQFTKDLNWTRLAEEMTANIRVGLAAGEAIARFDRPVAPKKLGLGWHAAMVVAAACAIFAVAFWSSLPPQQAQHLMASLRRIRVERLGMFVRSPALASDEVVLEASSSGIELKENGGAMSLTHPHAEGGTVSVSLQGEAGVRFVDADTGQVTTNKVYYGEQ
ncbi:MAG TPA: hypothetical protein VMU80_29095 [Bryobacteraceae bacterium]|nr:hypothetical protein [Bryobacteraceae bacterium]HUO33305.1 hypothetical protein [Bryobacteraceae bacterium]